MSAADISCGYQFDFPYATGRCRSNDFGDGDTLSVRRLSRTEQHGLEAEIAAGMDVIPS